MSKYTQTNCNDIIKLSWEVLEDGRQWVRGTNKDGTPFEFEDELSDPEDDDATKRAAAEAFLIANCEYVGAPSDNSVASKSIL